MDLHHMVRLNGLTTTIEAAMDAQCVNLADVIEALALLASEKADRAIGDDLAETAWLNASTHLFALSQGGRLFRAPTARDVG